MTNTQLPVCVVCGKPHKPSALHQISALSAGVAALIREALPDAPATGLICRTDEAQFRRRYVEKLLEAERGQISLLDRDVLDSFSKDATITADADLAFEGNRSFGQRAADTVATFGGSWRFILIFLAMLVVWMLVNSLGLLLRSFDPYPFILLNLVLSCVAALQAPIIMMSQRRQEAKDRMRAENDYRINLKAELEIRHLHEKIDHQMARQWERLAAIQQMQIELLEEAAGRPVKV